VQIELDETRHVLYTRSENSTIQVFYLGPNGADTSKICYLTCNAIATKAAGFIKYVFFRLFLILFSELTIYSKFSLITEC